MHKHKLVCMGDSLTEGYGIDLSQRWTDLLARETGWEIINSGISGDTTGGMVARFQFMVINHHPSHVIILGGSNDVFFGLPHAQIVSQVHAMTRWARHHNITALVGIPTPHFEKGATHYDSPFVTPIEFSRNLDEYRRVLQDYMMADGQILIDFSCGMMADMFLGDGVHPNAKGHEQMKENAKAVLQKIL